MYCQLPRPEVNYYNASILVSNEYGRSLVSPSQFFVAPNDTLYNYQTYARKLLIHNQFYFQIIKVFYAFQR